MTFETMLPNNLVCDIFINCNLRDKVWPNILFSVDCRFLFPADVNDEIYIIMVRNAQLQGYYQCFLCNDGLVQLSNL